MSEAIARAEKLEDYHKVEGHLHPDAACNPYTDVHKLVKMLKSEKPYNGLGMNCNDQNK